MEPYNDKLQTKRAESILKILNKPDLKEDARRIWTMHLKRLCKTKEQYEARYKGYIT